MGVRVNKEPGKEACVVAFLLFICHYDLIPCIFPFVITYVLFIFSALLGFPRYIVFPFYRFSAFPPLPLFPLLPRFPSTIACDKSSFKMVCEKAWHNFPLISTCAK
ncbi:hypothetical protein POVWA2_030310 [Plasmodium ovale wallikeri]|uniref:Uncharacterized protein n=1 Tax=Plasmodium ovale wallikeri TaxID=864142 RepID=A0A1A8YXW6_PLAOA|nr:hypothetical protein POVWA1_030720 [Plasmodium ovale wallikeri]SBT36451.1 hypothetical protein POVWA2_030310 [Plasmodium ovale wallikeri]